MNEIIRNAVSSMKDSVMELSGGKGATLSVEIKLPEDKVLGFEAIFPPEKEEAEEEKPSGEKVWCIGKPEEDGVYEGITSHEVAYNLRLFTFKDGRFLDFDSGEPLNEDIIMYKTPDDEVIEFFGLNDEEDCDESDNVRETDLGQDEFFKEFVEKFIRSLNDD